MGGSLALGKWRKIGGDSAFYGRAIADFNEAIRLDPNDASAYTARGNAYNATGEIDRADADFNQAKRLAAQPRRQ
jgi:Flp pilus assembly protein TadD